jgi:PilZ domain
LSPASGKANARLRFSELPTAKMYIDYVNARAVRTKPRPVLVRDISPEGLQFVTILDLPVNQRYIVGFEFNILGERFRFQGHIIRRLAEENLYIYRLKFIMNDPMRYSLIRLLNNLVVHLCPAQNKIHKLYGRISVQYYNFRCFYGDNK